MRIKRLIITFFLIILFLPFLQSISGFFEIKPLKENRYRADRPLISVKSFTNKFAKRYEEYFNDSYGFRDFLVKLKNQLDYSLFNKSGEIVFGRDHWLFYKNVVEDLEIVSERASEKDFKELCGSLLNMNKYLQERGIRLIVVPIPMKNTIYPEMLLPHTVRRPTNTVFQRYRAFLSNHPEIAWLDVQNRLQELKKEMPIFHKTDFHWNDIAGSYVATDLIDLMGKLSGTGVMWNHEIIINKEKLSGWQNNSLGIFKPHIESTLMLKSYPYQGVGVFEKEDGKNHWKYIANNKSPNQLLPKTVIFANSFADAFLRGGFTIYFSEMQSYYVHNLRERFPLISDDTKFVIFEHIEMDLAEMLKNDNFWPDSLLEN